MILSWKAKRASSCVLVDPDLVPGARDVNNEDDKGQEHQVEEAHAAPLEVVEFLRHVVEGLRLGVVQVSGTARVGIRLVKHL